MLGVVKSVLGQLNTGALGGVTSAETEGGESATGDDEPAGGATTDGSEGPTPPYLYECPSCGRIYVAAEKHTCGTCETAVDRVD